MRWRSSLLRSSRLFACASVGLVASADLAACATTGSFDGTFYRGKDVSFRLSPIPASWRRVDLASANLAFRDSSRDASILINSRCSTSDRDAPLLSLTEHLIIGTTQRRVLREETLPFDAREARHTVLEARLDGVPMAYDIFVLKKDGCIFDFVYVTAPDVGPAGAEEFDRFVTGFHTVPSSG